MLWRADRLVLASDEGWNGKFQGSAGLLPPARTRTCFLSSNTTTLRSRWTHMTRYTSKSIIRTLKTIAIHKPPIQADFCYVPSLNLNGSVIRVRLFTPGSHVGKQATPESRSLAHRHGANPNQSFAGQDIQARGAFPAE